MEKEKSVLKNVLHQNGYADAQINKPFRKPLSNVGSMRDEDSRTQPELERLMWQCVQDTADKIARALTRHQTTATFKLSREIKELLHSVKGTMALVTANIYKIHCRCGDAKMGEMKRLVGTRVKGHIQH